jgi:hypothetical protein
VSPDRERIFTKRGAAMGVAVIALVTIALTAVGAALAATLLVVF